MRLLLLRHGPAESGSTWAGDDASRPLTEAGRRKVADVGLALERIGLDCDAVLTSPYVRARETAEIVADALGFTDRLVEEPRLESGFGIGELRWILNAHADADELMLVGHEPDFSDVTSELVGGGRIELKKGGLVRIDLDDASDGTGTLVWLLQPTVLGA